MELGIWIVVAFVALVLLWFILYFIPIGLWFSALVSGVRISLIQLVLMRFRKVPPSVIVNQLIAGTKAGLHLTANDLEAHYLAGGNVPNVVTALISALTGKSVRGDICMTGEITLRGRVLPVGGIKEKVLAGVARGIGHVILPAKNQKDLEDIPQELRRKIVVHTVDSIDEVLPLVFEK